PVVCAVHGFAFGGGHELAMACHYRVAATTARVGQPEVKLGLIPGAGGTQRLPRLAGMAKAAEMCAIGEPIDAAEAQRSGIVDRVVQGDLLAEAVGFARELVVRGEPPRRTCDLAVVVQDPQASEALRARLQKRNPHLFAPRKAVEAVEASA